MAKTVEQLEAENKELQRQLAKTTKKLQVAEATRPKGAKPTVEVKGKHYLVLAGERTAQGTKTREELAADAKRCAELVEQGSGLLQLVETK